MIIVDRIEGDRAVLEMGGEIIEVPFSVLPDETKDEKLATHILEAHRSPDIHEPEVPTEFLKKYIAYARQNVSPKLSHSALEEIKSFYLKMRGGSGGEEGIRAVPISARQLEALVRLAEASAKLRLSDEVSREDARRGIELLEYSLSQIGLDKETGQIDIDRIATGISASERSHIQVVKEIITGLEGKLGKTIPIDDVVSEAKDKGINEEKGVFWQIANMVKCNKHSPKGINTGKRAFWEITGMVKCKETSLKALIKGKVPFGR